MNYDSKDGHFGSFGKSLECVTKVNNMSSNSGMAGWSMKPIKGKLFDETMESMEPPSLRNNVG